MPSLGADMEFGTLLQWLVKPGDTVKRGDIVAVVDTSKAEIEVEIFEDGVIDELLVPEHTRVPVGAALATLHAVGAAPASAAPPPAEAASVAAPPPTEAAPVAAAPPTEAPPAEPPSVAVAPHPDHPRISPLARRTAEDLGVDLASVAGTGPEGAITRDDVTRAAGTAVAPAPTAAPPVAAPASGEAAAPPRTGLQGEERRDAMREAIGALMARSKREIPHYYLQREIDLSRALAWLEEENARRAVDARLIPSLLLLAAVARAAAQTPAMNGFWVEEAFRPSAAVHLGVAIAQRGGGLIAPALCDADGKRLDELMAALRELVARVRGGRLRASEMSDATITVTNLGDGGVDLVHGVIYPPQVALVGFGGIAPRPHALDGLLGVRPTVIATLAADHRVSDGRTGSRFLSLIERLLQTPEELR